MYKAQNTIYKLAFVCILWKDLSFRIYTSKGRILQNTTSKLEYKAMISIGRMRFRYFKEAYTYSYNHVQLKIVADAIGIKNAGF